MIQLTLDSELIFNFSSQTQQWRKATSSVTKSDLTKETTHCGVKLKIGQNSSIGNWPNKFEVEQKKSAY